MSLISCSNSVVLETTVQYNFKKFQYYYHSNDLGSEVYGEKYRTAEFNGKPYYFLDVILLTSDLDSWERCYAFGNVILLILEYAVGLLFCLFLHIVCMNVIDRIGQFNIKIGVAWIAKTLRYFALHADFWFCMIYLICIGNILSYDNNDNDWISCQKTKLMLCQFFFNGNCLI